MKKMTKKEKEYLKVTAIRAIVVFIAFIIVIAINCFTLKTNLMLSFFKDERLHILRLADQVGWSEELTKDWKTNLSDVQNISESSTYGEFMVQASSLVKGIVLSLEIALTFSLSAIVYLYGKNVIKRCRIFIRRRYLS